MATGKIQSKWGRATGWRGGHRECRVRRREKKGVKEREKRISQG
jgi:hypothetical protein